MEAEAATPGRLRTALPVTGDLRLAFLGVFLSSLLGFLAVGCVLPVLPRYVKGPLGAGDVAVGVVIGAFAFSAIVGRPWAGRTADARGRRTVVTVGALITATAGVLYFVPAGVPGLVVARLFLGFGEGAVFTAGATWVVDLASDNRRGQAIGLFGLSVWTGLSVGPLIGEGLLAAGGYEAVWAFAALSPLAGALVARRLPDTHPRSVLERRSLLPRAALRPGLALALAQFGYASVAAFIVLYLGSRGGHGTVVFSVFAAAVVGSRLLASRLPDVVGARRSAVAAGAAEALGLVVIALAGTWIVAAIGAMVMGVGFSLLFPSLALLVVNDSGEDRRGEALGTFTAFFDLGVGIGAPLAGLIASVAGYEAAFWAAAACALAGGIVTAAGAPRVRAAFER